MFLLSGIIKNTCEGYKGSVLIEPEQAVEKADYKCGKSFYLDPILDTYKKKIIENPIVDEILEMIQKANIERLDFGLNKITKDHSHVVFTNETKYQNYRVFSHDVTAAILVSQNNETTAMLVSQTNPVGFEFFSYVNAFFCSNKFA